MFARPHPKEASYPPWRHAVERSTSGRPDVSFQGRYLQRLDELMSVFEGIGLTLARRADGSIDPAGPARVHAADPDVVALLMPTRLKREPLTEREAEHG